MVGSTSPQKVASTHMVLLLVLWFVTIVPLAIGWLFAFSVFGLSAQMWITGVFLIAAMSMMVVGSIIVWKVALSRSVAEAGMSWMLCWVFFVLSLLSLVLLLLIPEHLGDDSISVTIKLFAFGSLLGLPLTYSWLLARKY